MAEAIGAVLPFAVGVGISPVPVIAAILTLLSTRARVNGPLFLLGWMVGLGLVVAVMHLLAGALDVGTGAAVDDGVSWLRIALGVLLLLAAVREWRKRPEAGEEATVPRWMSGVEDLAPVRALALALVLSANPKNLMLAFGAVTSLAEEGAVPGEALAALAAFVLIGSAAVIVAVAYQVLGGDRARHRLVDVKAWLTLHNSAVMAVLYLVFAAVLVSNGLGRRG